MHLSGSAIRYHIINKIFSNCHEQIILATMVALLAFPAYAPCCPQTEAMAFSRATIEQRQKTHQHLMYRARSWKMDQSQVLVNNAIAQCHMTDQLLAFTHRIHRTRRLRHVK